MGKDKDNEQEKTSDKIAGFLQKYRIAFLTLLILIVAGIVGSTAFFVIRGELQKKAIAKVEVFERQKNDVQNDPAKSAEFDTLLNEIVAFASSTFGYASARSYHLAADMYFSKGEWEKAENAWTEAARKAPKTYLSPLSLFNAAVAAEEQGKLEAAINYYSQSLEFSGIYPAAARARFNIGRIHETLNDTSKAAEAYRQLIENTPESNWAKLAQNRIIVIENN
jgi:tetratricopeptide (TPR) repeat protein